MSKTLEQMIEELYSFHINISKPIRALEYFGGTADYDVEWRSKSKDAMDARDRAIRAFHGEQNHIQQFPNPWETVTYKGTSG